MFIESVLAFIIAIGVLIFVHELGHFATAKWVDIEVPRFSIGFGPKVVGFRRGETEYVISALPLGGYVKMAGMEEMEQVEGGPLTVNDTVGDDETIQQAREGIHPHRPRDFESKSLPARALVISAGVIMNLLFAVVTFSAISAIWGVPADPGARIGGIADELLPDGATALAELAPGQVVSHVNGAPVTTWRELTLALTRARAGETRLDFTDGTAVTFMLPASDEERGRLLGAIQPVFQPVLADVERTGPAGRAGLQPGDRIVNAAGRPVGTWQEFVSTIEQNAGTAIGITVERNGRLSEHSVTPEEREVEGETVVRIGVARATQLTRANPVQALQSGFTQTWDVTVLTVDFLGGMLTGQHSARNIGGPIMIGQMSGQFARRGIREFLGFMAVLSINLAILNLLPIPVLDGGHLVFIGIEAVRGRPLSFGTRMKLTQVGFVFIILLMAWAIGNDLLRTVGI